MDAPQLDALVATQIMQWESQKVGSATHYITKRGEDPDLAGWKTEHWISAERWRPSGSMADAWRVVERMQSLGWVIELRIDPTLSVEPNTVFFYNGGGLGFRPQPIVESDDSMALAIVRGALKALRVEVEE